MILLRGVEAHHGLARGVPTDETLKSLYSGIGIAPPPGEMDPDRSRCGMLYALPMLPLSGAQARECMMLTEDVLGRCGFKPYVTLNVVDERTLEAVVNLAFDRDKPDETKRAQSCIEEYHAALIDRGMMPYRVGIQSMRQVVDEGSAFWQTASDIKAALDPNAIISPGRYSLR
jgi:4-cresol dehydrogenase (hydroxylating)